MTTNHSGKLDTIQLGRISNFNYKLPFWSFRNKHSLFIVLKADFMNISHCIIHRYNGFCIFCANFIEYSERIYASFIGIIWVITMIYFMHVFFFCIRKLHVCRQLNNLLHPYCCSTVHACACIWHDIALPRFVHVYFYEHAHMHTSCYITKANCFPD